MSRLYWIGLLLIPATVGADSLVITAPKVEWVSDLSDQKKIINPTCYEPHISGDGRFVVFEVRDAAVSSKTSSYRHIVLFDRKSRNISQITPDEESSNGGPRISGNGRYVVFHSYPLETVLGKSPRIANIFLHDRAKNINQRLKMGLAEPNQDGESLYPQINIDGRFVLFSSNGTHFNDRPYFPIRAIYLMDRHLGSLELISQTVTGLPANRPSGEPKMSQNGRFVAFKSAATNLVRLRPLESLSIHLYVLDRSEREMIQIDEASRGFDVTRYRVGRYDMDDPGRTVVFEGHPRNIDDPSETINKADLFLYSSRNEQIVKLTTGLFEGRSHTPTLSGDGRYLSFVFNGIENEMSSGLIVYDIENSVWRNAHPGTVYNPVMTRNGEEIVFESNEMGLPPIGKKDVHHIYVIKNPFIE